MVYPWKTPPYTPTPNYARRPFAALVTSNLPWSARKVVEYDELRRPMEVFFRELKGQSGWRD